MKDAEKIAWHLEEDMAKTLKSQTNMAMKISKVEAWNVNIAKSRMKSYVKGFMKVMR